MGTSSSHRSPSTPEWERVKQLYREPHPDPKAIVSRITSALDPDTRRGMSGPGVVCCLSHLLRASRQTAQAGLSLLVTPAAEIPPLLAASEIIRERAERDIARLGLASRFSDLALNALATAVFEAGSGESPELFKIDLQCADSELGSYAREGRLHDLARVFVGHDLDHVFRYVIARDSAEFIGGPGLPTAAEASLLRDAAARYCRQSVAQIDAARYEDALSAALRAADDEAMAQVQPVLSGLLDAGLQRLAAGG